MICGAVSLDRSQMSLEFLEPLIGIFMIYSVILLKRENYQLTFVFYVSVQKPSKYRGLIYDLSQYFGKMNLIVLRSRSDRSISLSVICVSRTVKINAVD